MVFMCLSETIMCLCVDPNVLRLCVIMFFESPHIPSLQVLQIGSPLLQKEISYYRREAVTI